VDVARTKITAPIDGVVISRNVDEGQTVAASFNTPKLFVIANDLTKMQIEAAVSEADLGGVEEGQKVNFQVDAFPNRKFLGSVKQVRYAAMTNQNVVTYTAVVEVSNPDLKLRPGMTATARIVTGQKPGVLKIPNSALRFRPPPNLTVQVQTNAVASGGPTNGAAAAAVATDESGVPIPPWRAEGRRPAPDEFQKWLASLTPEQKEKAQESMRRRFAEGGGGGGFGGRGGGGGGGFGDGARSKPEGPTTATVYVLEKAVGADGKESQIVKAVTIKAGITDGSSTEVIEGVKEGDTLITAITTATLAGPTQPQSNPFAPSFGRPTSSGQRGGQQQRR
ncbi:MAG: efflux RND transporter periplasmic adaptor subunit, partial [Verrucomicrobiales bacterium]|nr:efflux RND transporter periplasmic adaptor subunit [Verrucomicrobiales bacterium]